MPSLSTRSNWDSKQRDEPRRIYNSISLYTVEKLYIKIKYIYPYIGGLYKEEDKGAIQEGAQQMMKMAADVASRMSVNPGRLKLLRIISMVLLVCCGGVLSRYFVWCGDVRLVLVFLLFSLVVVAIGFCPIVDVSTSSIHSGFPIGAPTLLFSLSRVSCV